MFVSARPELCYIRRPELIIGPSVRTRYIKNAGNQGNDNKTETAPTRRRVHMAVMSTHWRKELWRWCLVTVPIAAVSHSLSTPAESETIYSRRF